MPEHDSAINASVCNKNCLTRRIMCLEFKQSAKNGPPSPAGQVLKESESSYLALVAVKGSVPNAPPEIVPEILSPSTVPSTANSIGCPWTSALSTAVIALPLTLPLSKTALPTIETLVPENAAPSCFRSTDNSTVWPGASTTQFHFPPTFTPAAALMSTFLAIVTVLGSTVISPSRLDTSAVIVSW